MRYIFAVIAVVLLIGAINVPAKAEADVSISFNVDRQPVWGPTGYDYVEYYYFPDMDVYYYVPGHRYYYLEKISGGMLHLCPADIVALTCTTPTK